MLTYQDSCMQKVILVAIACKKENLVCNFSTEANADFYDVLHEYSLNVDV